MATLTTKYSIGDRVWHASTRDVTKYHPCPDCKGAKKWKAESPAGTTYEFACPRCSTSYNSKSEMNLRFVAFEPRAVPLTIGSIKVDTHPWSETDSKNVYMCNETGVGSGNLYNEKDLFDTEKEALEVATLKAQEQTKTVPWVVKLYNESLRLSDFEMKHAEREEYQKLKWKLGYKYKDLIQDLRDMDDNHVNDLLDAFEEKFEEEEE